MTSWQQGLAQRLKGRLHYSWVVAAVIFCALLISAGVRSMPGVLLVPLQKDLGWDRATISLAISIRAEWMPESAPIRMRLTSA